MTKQIIGRGRESGGLYILDPIVPRSIACYRITTPFETHYKLGHPSLPLLKKSCPQFSSLSSLDCESCQFSKHHHLSSRPRVNKRVGFPFELVHSDVWGPCPIVSPTGFRYFVTFVDSSEVGEASRAGDEIPLPLEIGISENTPHNSLEHSEKLSKSSRKLSQSET